MRVLIRPETSLDYESIDRVLETAFSQKNEATLVRKLRETKDYLPELSLIATADKEPVGHILFYPLRNRGYTTLILAPMAVKPDLQKKGIGGKLIQQGLKRAVELGYESVILVGHSEYYPRFGFQKASKWGIKLNFEVPDEAFMAIELKKDSLKGKEGVIELPQPYMEC